MSMVSVEEADNRFYRFLKIAEAVALDLKALPELEEAAKEAKSVQAAAAGQTKPRAVPEQEANDKVPLSLSLSDELMFAYMHYQLKGDWAAMEAKMHPSDTVKCLKQLWDGLVSCTARAGPLMETYVAAVVRGRPLQHAFALAVSCLSKAERAKLLEATGPEDRPALEQVLSQAADGAAGSGDATGGSSAAADRTGQQQSYKQQSSRGHTSSKQQSGLPAGSEQQYSQAHGYAAGLQYTAAQQTQGVPPYSGMLPNMDAYTAAGMHWPSLVGMTAADAAAAAGFPPDVLGGSMAVDPEAQPSWTHGLAAKGQEQQQQQAAGVLQHMQPPKTKQQQQQQPSTSRPQVQQQEQQEQEPGKREREARESPAAAAAAAAAAGGPASAEAPAAAAARASHAATTAAAPFDAAAMSDASAAAAWAAAAKQAMQTGNPHALAGLVPKLLSQQEAREGRQQQGQVQQQQQQQQEQARQQGPGRSPTAHAAVRASAEAPHAATAGGEEAAAVGMEPEGQQVRSMQQQTPNLGPAGSRSRQQQQQQQQTHRAAAPDSDEKQLQRQQKQQKEAPVEKRQEQTQPPQPQPQQRSDVLGVLQQLAATPGGLQQALKLLPQLPPSAQQELFQQLQRLHEQRSAAKQQPQRQQQQQQQQQQPPTSSMQQPQQQQQSDAGVKAGAAPQAGPSTSTPLSRMTAPGLPSSKAPSAAGTGGVAQSGPKTGSAAAAAVAAAADTAGQAAGPAGLAAVPLTAHEGQGGKGSVSFQLPTQRSLGSAQPSTTQQVLPPGGLQATLSGGSPGGRGLASTNSSSSSGGAKPGLGRPFNWTGLLHRHSQGSSGGSAGGPLQLSASVPAALPSVLQAKEPAALSNTISEPAVAAAAAAAGAAAPPGVGARAGAAPRPAVGALSALAATLSAAAAAASKKAATAAGDPNSLKPSDLLQKTLSASAAAATGAGGNGSTEGPRIARGQAADAGSKRDAGAFAAAGTGAAGLAGLSSTAPGHRDSGPKSAGGLHPTATATAVGATRQQDPSGMGKAAAPGAAVTQPAGPSSQVAAGSKQPPAGSAPPAAATSPKAAAAPVGRAAGGLAANGRLKFGANVGPRLQHPSQQQRASTPGTQERPDRMPAAAQPQAQQGQQQGRVEGPAGGRGDARPQGQASSRPAGLANGVAARTAAGGHMAQGAASSSADRVPVGSKRPWAGQQHEACEAAGQRQKKPQLSG